MATSFDGLFGFTTGTGTGLSYDTLGGFVTEPAVVGGGTIAPLAAQYYRRMRGAEVRLLKQSTVKIFRIGPFVDATDGVTAETGLTISQADIQISKAGGAFAQTSDASPTTTHDADGWYQLPLTATDTGTLGLLTVQVVESGALMVWADFEVVPANVFDSLVSGSDKLDTGIGESVTGAVGSVTGAVGSVVGHTAQTGDSFARIGAPAGASVSADVAAVKVDTAATLVDTAEIGAAGAGLTAVPWNASWDAEVQSEVNDALVALNLDHLMAVAVAGTDVVDNSVIADLVSASATSDYDDYANTTDSLQAIRDRGDSAWITGGGGGITDIINITPAIPQSIDLADTASWRTGFHLTNALDDLPSTAEITPGTCSIHRKAIGGTSWSAVVTDGACSEAAGFIYLDEVFDSGSGYAEGDSIRFTFKSQKVTVAANDYEITDATGVIYYSLIRETERGTDSVAAAPTAATIADAVWDEATSGHVGVGSFGVQCGTDIDAILVDTGTTIPALIGTPVADLATDIAGVQTDTTAIVADTNELQTDWADGGRLDLILDAIVLDTATTIPGTITTIDTVVDAILAMLDDPRAEPGQGAPAVNADMATKVDWLFKLARNKKTQTATTLSIFADDGSTVDSKATVSDDGTTTTIGEIVTGP